ncbi:hypothetical protein MJO28_000379 [Puccinia striiformis f. sp. tritici]|uniref:Uncharacterized protein n=1 Tax=Puccinia striiformis f. sp. tritici TaxID=168172 RepID=A0ACC0EXS2_9BASI|nr:hypothetical protein MJO28_000379 [Puccinia striiformis f. sp. tritici]
MYENSNSRAGTHQDVRISPIGRRVEEGGQGEEEEIYSIDQRLVGRSKKPWHRLCRVLIDGKAEGTLPRLLNGKARWEVSLSMTSSQSTPIHNGRVINGRKIKVARSNEILIIRSDFLTPHEHVVEVFWTLDQECYFHDDIN